MLEELRDIAAKLGLSFAFGELQAFNKGADRLSCPILYHEGYIQGDKQADISGAIETSYSLSLWILRDSKLGDLPETRKVTITDLCDVADKIIIEIQANYRLSSARIQEGINLTDKNLDGVRLQLTAKTKTARKVC